MRISDAAAAAGCSPRMIRYYHRTGALPEPPRSSNGYRDYRLDDIARLIRLTTITRAGVPASAADADLQEALTAVETRIDQLRLQRQTLLDMLAGDRRIPPDVVALFDSTLRWFRPHGHSGHLTQERAALQLMVDTGMTTPETWRLLRRTLPDLQRRRLTADGYRAWDELGTLRPGAPAVSSLVERCSHAARHGITAGLTDTLIPGDLPLTPADHPTEGAQRQALEAILAEVTP